MGIPNYKQGRYLMFEYADNNHRTEQDLAYHISWGLADARSGENKLIR